MTLSVKQIEDWSGQRNREFRSAIALRMKARRESLDMSMSEMARECGVSKATFCHMEQGADAVPKHWPKLDKLLTVMTWLDLTLGDIEPPAEDRAAQLDDVKAVISRLDVPKLERDLLWSLIVSTHYALARGDAARLAVAR